MAMSFNNKGPFGGFYRYIGEEDTFKVYRDSMTDSEGKEVSSKMCRPSTDRTWNSSVPFAKDASQSRARRGCVPTMALLDKIDRAMGR